MKKIVLINPPSPFLMKERVFPNLGLIQLATSLKQNGQEVEIMDLCGSENPEQEIEKISNRYELFGFSSTTPQFIEVVKLNRKLKKKNPSARTIIGGAHPSAVYSLTLSGNYHDPNIDPLNQFDHIVVGEGDNLDLLNLKEKWIIAPTIKDLSKTPFPDRTFVDIKSYKYFLEGKETTILMTQRGCPFQCTFCCGRNIDMYRRVRSKSPEQIVEELDYLNSEFGYSSFMWFDDEVNVNSKRLSSISKLLRKRNYQHRGFIRSDLLLKNPKSLDDLVEAGFVELCSGVESGSQKILDIIQKKTTPEGNAKAAEMIMSAGLNYKAFTIIGNPSETYKDIEKTKEWIREVKPTGFDISILMPYPGSILYNEGKTSSKYPDFDKEWKGLYFKSIDYSSTKSFYKGKPGEYSCHVRTEELSSKDLIHLRDEMEKELKREITC